MKIIEMKLKDSLFELPDVIIIDTIRKIEVDESETVWVETPEAITQSEFQKIQDLVNESFPVNRVIVVPKGCTLKFDNPEKRLGKCRDANRFDEPMESQEEYKGEWPLETK